MEIRQDSSFLREVVLSSERIFEGKLIKVRRDQVRLPDGRTAFREVVEHPGAVGVVPVLEKEKVILVRQYRLPAGKALLEIPAGTRKAGESPEDCARRELIEEIGYSAGNLIPLFSLFLAPGYSTELLYFYLATDLKPLKGQAEEDEFLEVTTVPWEEVLPLIRSGEIADAKSVAGLLMACYQLGLLEHLKCD